MKSTSILRISLTAVLMVALAAGAAFAASNNKVLLVASVLEVTSLDPAIANDSSSRIILRSVYEPLLDWEGKKLEPQPKLATKYTVSPDGLVYTFTLRKGVKFTDGTPLNAEAVKFSFDRVKRIGQGPAWMIEPLAKTEVVDAYTVKMTLSRPFSPFPKFLPWIYIVSPTAIKQHDNNDESKKWLQTNMVGSGPYKLAEWEYGQQAVLVKNDDYWRGWRGNHVERIIRRIVKEPSAQKMLLERGDVDLALQISVNDLPAMRKNKDLVVHSDPSLSTYFIQMNTQKGPLKDPRVRQALTYAFDYGEMIEYGMNGFASRATGPFPEELVGKFTTGMPKYEFNLEKAKKLLAQAGYPNGFSIDFKYVTGLEEERKSGEILQANLKKIGVEVKLQELMWPTLLASLQKPETAADTFGFYNNPVYASPDSYIFYMYHSSMQGTKGRNLNYYTNDKVDDLGEQARKTPDVKKQQSIYREAAKIIANDFTGIPVFRSHFTVVARKNVKGYVFNPMLLEKFNFYEFYKD